MVDYEDYIKPYKKLAAAEDLLESNALLTQYIDLYKRKFKGVPIFPVNRAHLTTIKDFAKAAGPQAHAMIEHYFEMRDEWFIKQAYSLDCLLRNIQKVGASLSQSSSRRVNNAKMQINWGCDSCWKEFLLVVSIHYDFSKITRCKDCEEKNRPYVTVNKEERARFMSNIAKAFPEIPGDY